MEWHQKVMIDQKHDSSDLDECCVIKRHWRHRTEVRHSSLHVLEPKWTLYYLPSTSSIHAYSLAHFSNARQTKIKANSSGIIKDWICWRHSYHIIQAVNTPPQKMIGLCSILPISDLQSIRWSATFLSSYDIQKALWSSRYLYRDGYTMRGKPGE